jgi:hypothetical protein
MLQRALQLESIIFNLNLLWHLSSASQLLRALPIKPLDRPRNTSLPSKKKSEREGGCSTYQHPPEEEGGICCSI